MIEKNVSAAGTIIIDDRYAPLLVSSFIGEIDLEQGRWYEEVSLRVITREAGLGRRLVLVHDASRSTRANAEMRKFWADMSRRSASIMEVRTLGSLVVVSNAIIRGVLTAVGWLNPEVAKLKTFPSLTSAVNEALNLLDAAGTPVKLPPGGYELPSDLLPVSAAG